MPCCALGESYTRAYPDVMKLHMLQEIEDAWGILQQVGAAIAWCRRICVFVDELPDDKPLICAGHGA